MSGDERRTLIDLIRLYVDRTTEEVTGNEWRKIETAGLYATRVTGRLHSLHTTARREGWPDVQARRLQ
jgi:hypothetical protein